jgi:acyl-CoA thioesterase FadM
MFPWLRLFGVGLSLIGKSKVDVLATTRVRLRVWPNDLDYNLHVNNGRYLALAQISGVYWFVRTGSLGIARQHKAFLVIGDALAKFRHDLKVFQTFEIHTRVIGWDSKWVFFEHRFVRKDRVIGVVAGRAVLKAQSGTIDLQVVSAELGHSAPSPKLPEWVRCFDQGAELLSELVRDEERSKGIPSDLRRCPERSFNATQTSMFRRGTLILRNSQLARPGRTLNRATWALGQKQRTCAVQLGMCALGQ